MAKSLHGDVSPYSEDAQSPIIDKNLAKWEPLLAVLAIFAMLLPAAAEANTTGLIALSFLFLRRYQKLETLNPAVKGYLRILVTALATLWVTRLFLWIIAFADAEAGGFSLHMRMLGKQGLYGFLIILFFCALSQMRPKNQDILHPKVVLGFCVSVALYALGQRYFAWDFVHGWHARLGDNRFAYGVYRASAWMGHPLTLAYNALLLSALSYAHGRYLWAEGRRKDARLWIAIAASCVVIVYLSQTRSALLIGAALLGFDLWFTLRKPYRLVLLLSAAFGLALLALAWDRLGRWSELVDPNVPWERRFDRLLFWKAHWALFIEHPLTGTGLGAYEGRLLDTYAAAGYTGLERKYNAHNIFLQTLADSGLVGGAALLLLLGALGRCAIQAKKRFRHSGLVFVFLVTFCGGLVQNNLRDSEYLFALWTSLGLVLFWLSDQGKRDESTGGEQSEDH